MVEEGAVVVDVAMNRADGKLVGDVDYQDVSEKASYITPVPGGVGPMTVVMLMRNTLIATERQNHLVTLQVDHDEQSGCQACRRRRGIPLGGAGRITERADTGRPRGAPRVPGSRSRRKLRGEAQRGPDWEGNAVCAVIGEEWTAGTRTDGWFLPEISTTCFIRD